MSEPTIFAKPPDALQLELDAVEAELDEVRGTGRVYAGHEIEAVLEGRRAMLKRQIEEGGRS